MLCRGRVDAIGRSQDAADRARQEAQQQQNYGDQSCGHQLCNEWIIHRALVSVNVQESGAANNNHPPVPTFRFENTFAMEHTIAASLFFQWQKLTANKKCSQTRVWEHCNDVLRLVVSAQRRALGLGPRNDAARCPWAASRPLQASRGRFTPNQPRSATKPRPIPANVEGSGTVVIDAPSTMSGSGSETAKR